MAPERPKVGVVADDLTGAGDAALAFARAGWDAALSIGAPAARGPRASAWVISTESRHLSARAAAARVRRAVRALRGWKAAFVFKKIDSTLRGPVGAEASAFMDAAGVGSMDVVPAFPAAGRAVKGGRLFVGGVPLHRTAFARDPRHPRRTDRVEDALGPAADRLRIPDAVSDGDLDRIAAALLRRGERAAAGSAGFAGALARAMGRGFPAAAPKGGTPGGGAVLLLSGSAHPMSEVQRRKVQGTPGVTVVAPPAGRGAPEKILKDLVRRAAAAARRKKIRRFAVTGGETAAAFARALGVRRWRVRGAVDVGVPLLSAAGPGPRTWWALKPGGFGREDVWRRAIACLTKT